MKKLLFILLLIAPIYLYAQNDSIVISDLYKIEIEGIKYCNYRFAKESLTGIGIGLGGGLISIVPLSSNNSGTRNVGLAMCAISGLTGTIFMIDSFKWMKRAGVSPADYGLGFKLDLDRRSNKTSKRKHFYKSFSSSEKDDMYGWIRDRNKKKQ